MTMDSWRKLSEEEGGEQINLDGLYGKCYIVEDVNKMIQVKGFTRLKGYFEALRSQTEDRNPPQ